MITTWLTDNDLKEYSQVQDKELNELFQEVRMITGNRFYLQESFWKDNPPFWRKAKPTITYYTLYVTNGKSGWDAQVINFARDHDHDHDWSINTSVTRSYIMTYFYGLLSAVPQTERV